MEELLEGRRSETGTGMSPILGGTALPLKEQVCSMRFCLDLGLLNKWQKWSGIPFSQALAAAVCGQERSDHIFLPQGDLSVSLYLIFHQRVKMIQRGSGFPTLISPLLYLCFVLLYFNSLKLFLSVHILTAF